MSHTLTVDFNKPIRLFPLAKCILLPHATLPLHIFEPRYRAMTRDALDSDGLIAMATFDGDAFMDDYEGTPPIRPHVCVGYLTHHERLYDGRYNILLQVSRGRASTKKSTCMKTATAAPSSAPRAERHGDRPGDATTSTRSTHQQRPPPAAQLHPQHPQLAGAGPADTGRG